MKRLVFAALIAILAVFAISTSAHAKTDIFGEGREFTLTYGEELATMHYGFRPLEDQMFSWGITASSLLSRAEPDDSLQAKEWFAGLYVEHPVLQVTGLPGMQSSIVSAEVFGGAELQYQFDTNQELYFTPYLGINVNVSENVSVRTDWRYNSRDTILDKHILSVGVCVQW